MWETVYASTFLKDYVGLWLNFDRRLIEFRRVLHRSQIYRSFP